MKKRGTSHIEMVLAFVLFLAVVSVAFYIFNPFKSENAPTDADYIMQNLVNSFSENVFSYTIIINNTEEQANDQVLQVNLNIILDGLNVSISNYSGDSIPAWISSNLIYFRWNKDFGNTVFIKASKAITSASLDNNLPIDEAVDNYYAISSWQTLRVLSENKTLDSISSYNIEYLSFKRGLKIPDNTDFTFNLSVSSLPATNWKTPPKNSQVDSQARYFEFMASDGSISLVQLEVRAW